MILIGLTPTNSYLNEGRKIVYVELLAGLNERNHHDLPNWLGIQVLIPSTIPLELLDFAQAHLSTKTKIDYADYHYNILNQVYVPGVTDREPDTVEWARTELTLDNF